MNASLFATLPGQTQTSLAKTSAAVAGVVPLEVRSWKISVSKLPPELKDLAVVKEVSDWAAKSEACLYFFDCSSQEIDLSQVEQAFAFAKDHKINDRAYSRLRIPAIADSDSILMADTILR